LISAGSVRNRSEPTLPSRMPGSTTSGFMNWVK